MSKIDLTSFEWRELVFGDRNKEYGAYILRENSPKRHKKAIIWVSILAVLIFSVPKLIELAKPRQKEVMIDQTVLSDLKKKAEVKQDLKKPISTEPPPQVKSSLKFTAPVIKKDEEVKDEDEIKNMDDLNKSNMAISIADVVGNDDKNGELIEDVKVAITEEEKPFDVVEQMPTFPGGESELMAFISKNINYPASALENGIQGKVIVRFVVNKNGEVDRGELIRTLDPACDREALRIIKIMPKWIPGRQNGENVPVWFTLPINFRLQ
jgi:periplasmic protein TonB